MADDPLDPGLVAAVKQFEGFAPAASWDYKQYTNGYGTRATAPGETIDRDTAEQRLQDELLKARAQAVAVNPNAPPGVQNALTSLTFDAGNGWANSGLGAAVRAGDWDTARQHFLSYNKAGGQTNPGLVSRRAAEAAWFDAPPVAPGAPPQVSAPLSANAAGQAQTAPQPYFAAAQPQASPSAAGQAGADFQPPAPTPLQPMQLPPAWRPRVALQPSVLGTLRQPFFQRG